MNLFLIKYIPAAFADVTRTFGDGTLSAEPNISLTLMSFSAFCIGFGNLERVNELTNFFVTGMSINAVQAALVQSFYA